ncbi:MAG: hypothetical protein RLY93_20820 [Sumerlaeia bacterium]
MIRPLSGLAIAAVLAAGAVSEVRAQGGFAAGGLAPPSAMDTLNEGGTGPSGGFGIDRARGAVDQANARDPFGGGGGAAADPFGVGGGAAADPFGGGGGADPFGGGGGDFAASGPAFVDPGQVPGAATPGVNVPRIQVIWGERIIDANTGEILQDARKLRVPSLVQNEYYNDGEQGMDFEADDRVWTNVTLRDDVVSPETHFIKTKLLRALEVAENTDPMRFAGVRVATSEQLSTVPKILDLEAERDEKLKQWAQRFLRDFRTDPDNDDPASFSFVETYMPAPPRVPDVNIPASFAPPQASAGGAGAGGLGPTGGNIGAGTRGGVRNAFSVDTIQDSPGASSSYFGGGNASGVSVVDSQVGGF